MTKKAKLKRESDIYIQTFNISPAERQKLLAWIQDGNSAYDNPWFMTDERGCPIDYVSAVREVNDYRLVNDL